MELVAVAAGWILMAAALISAGCMLVAAAMTRRLMGPRAPATAQFPSVTLLKPLNGAEPGLRENLGSFCAQDYPGPVQIVFGVQCGDDPAIAVVKELQGRYPELDAELVIDERAHGSNPKISNLINMTARAKHEVLILSDSDIGVAPDYLGRVIDALDRPGVGAVTCLYTGRPLANVWSRLAAKWINYHFLPSVIFGTAMGLAEPCLGATIAIRRSVLEEIGGFAAYRDCLADDYEIGRAVREKGYIVALPPMVVDHTCADMTVGALLAHELRWARTIRTLDTPGHWGSFITHPIPLALLGALFLGPSLPTGLVLFVALFSRLVLRWRMDRIFGVSAGPAWLLPLRDVLSFGVFMVSLFGGSVEWRGTRFNVAPSGVLSEL